MNDVARRFLAGDLPSVARGIEMYVYVVNAHAEFRLEALRSFRGLDRIVSSFWSPSDFMTLLDSFDPGCILLIAPSLQADDLDLLHQIVQRRRDLPIVTVDDSRSIANAVRLMRAGAVDVLSDIRDLDAVRTVLDHASAILGERTEHEKQKRDALRAAATLNKREITILREVVIGKTSKEIGVELEISTRTVEMHRANIMRKIGADSLAALVRISILSGLASLTSSDRAA